MTRKEKVEIKTLKFCQEICNAMKGKDKLTEGAKEADKFINLQIKLRPQEKTFILNCAHKVAAKLNETLDIIIKEKASVEAKNILERLQNAL